MNYNNWVAINKDIAKYLEKNILPNLLAFVIARLYYTGELKDNYDTLYNTTKAYINLVGERKKIVTSIMGNILLNRYQLKIVRLYPKISIKKALSDFKERE